MCGLWVVMLIMLSPAAFAQAYTSSDISNPGRRITSLTAEMDRAYARLIDHWRQAERGNRAVDTLFNVWMESELFSGLPLDSSGRPSRLDSLELLRAYTEMRYFAVGKDMRWSAGVTAARIAYGLQRYYELGDESGRWGRDRFDGQVREAVYLFHGHYDAYEFEFGYLRSTTEEGSPFSTSGEFVNSGEWWVGKLGAEGVNLTIRQSLLGSKPVDLVLFDAEILEVLRRLKKFGGDFDVYEGRALSFSLLGEVTKFETVKTVPRPRPRET